MNLDDKTPAGDMNKPEYEPTHADDLMFEASELIPAFSIDATDPEEARLVKIQLATDAEAAQDLAAYTALADALLYSAPSVQAPAHLADRLSAALASSRLAPSSPIHGQSAPGSVWTRFRTRFPGGSLRFATVATVMLMLLLLNVTSMMRIRALQVEQEQLIQQIHYHEYARQYLTEQIAQQDTAIVMLASEDLLEVDLPAAQEGSAAIAKVAWHPEWNLALVYAEDFPQLDSDHVYQLWLVRGDIRTSGGLFTVNDAGMGTLIVSLDQPLDTFDTLGVTPEPAGGSDGPTAPPVVRGPVTG